MTAQRQKIAGKYLIRAVLPASYELTGNARNAEFYFTGDSALNTVCMTKDYYGVGGAKFLFESQIKINRARIMAAGGYGLQAPQDGSPAASLIIGINQFADGSGVSLGTGFIRFSNWGEWEEKNLVYRPFNGTPGSWTGAAFEHSKPVCFKAIQQNSDFKCDDYNLQEDFVGQTITPVIEMEIETNGIIDDVTGKIY